jgi:hypothetical protein
MKGILKKKVVKHSCLIKIQSLYNLVKSLSNFFNLNPYLNYLHIFLKFNGSNKMTV